MEEEANLEDLRQLREELLMALEDWIPFSVVIKAQDPYEEGVAFFVVLDAVIVAAVAEQPVVPT